MKKSLRPVESPCQGEFAEKKGIRGGIQSLEAKISQPREEIAQKVR